MGKVTSKDMSEDSPTLEKATDPLSIDETESLKISSNDTNNNVKGKQALSTVTEKKTEELSAVEKCSQIVDVKNKKSNNSNSNVTVEKKLTIEDTNDKEQNQDKKELL